MVSRYAAHWYIARPALFSLLSQTLAEHLTNDKWFPGVYIRWEDKEKEKVKGRKKLKGKKERERPERRDKGKKKSIVLERKTRIKKEKVAKKKPEK